jgi:hypothetical protein
MTTYRIIHDNKTGQVNSICKDERISIPLSGPDFADFLRWNAKQAQPLDYTTPIEPEVIPDTPTTEERVTAIEDALLAILIGE